MKKKIYIAVGIVVAVISVVFLISRCVSPKNTVKTYPLPESYVKIKPSLYQSKLAIIMDNNTVKIISSNLEETTEDFEIDIKDFIFGFSEEQYYIIDNNNTLYGYNTESKKYSEIYKNVAKFLEYYNSYFCITTDGELFVWGDNEDGALGLSSKYLNTPTKVEIPGKIIDVTTSGRYTLILDSTGNVYETGYIDQYYDKETKSWEGIYSFEFKKINDIKNITSISTRGESLALDINEKVYFWIGGYTSQNQSPYINDTADIIKYFDGIKTENIYTSTRSYFAFTDKKAVIMWGEDFPWNFEGKGMNWVRSPAKVAVADEVYVTSTAVFLVNDNKLSVLR
jgi:alpha-tubulin suppressor-like RCC1 family protein